MLVRVVGVEMEVIWVSSWMDEASTLELLLLPPNAHSLLEEATSLLPSIVPCPPFL